MTMQLAISQAEIAYGLGEVPVGAVIVDSKSKQIIVSCHNLVETCGDPTAHAEILAIRAACDKIGSKFLTDCDIYVTLEPCPMCSQAIAFARMRRVYFGAYDPKGGGVEQGACIFNQPTCNHKPQIIGGIKESECSNLLKDFFGDRR